MKKILIPLVIALLLTLIVCVYIKKNESRVVTSTIASSTPEVVAVDVIASSTIVDNTIYVVDAVKPTPEVKPVQLVTKDMYKNIDTILPYKDNDFGEHFSMLSNYEKNILEKISTLYQEKLNKEQGYKNIESNKLYYAVRDAHLYYYNKNIAIASLSGADPLIYNIAENTISKELNFWSRGGLIASKNYLIALKSADEIIYFNKLTGKFEALVNSFTLKENELFYSSCVDEGGCTRDVVVSGNTLIIGIYKKGERDTQGVYKNIKLREERVILK